MSYVSWSSYPFWCLRQLRDRQTRNAIEITTIDCHHSVGPATEQLLQLTDRQRAAQAGAPLVWQLRLVIAFPRAMERPPSTSSSHVSFASQWKYLDGSLFLRAYHLSSLSVHISQRKNGRA